MDNSGPVLIEGRGDAPSREASSYNCHPNFEVSLTYANGPNGTNGTVVRCMSRGENGVQFNGEDGKWIFVSRGAIRASEQRLLEEPLPRDATRLQQVTNGHMGNFIDCVRSRQQPICNVNVGHRSVSVCHLANIGVRTGKRLRWDPQQERFTGENADEGNRMLARQMRAPWAEYYRELLGNA
jgi:hypothetical protein